MVSVLKPLKEQRPDCFKELCNWGSLVVHKLEAQAPLVLVPIQSIQGKLPSVLLGDTRTIPFESSASTRAGREALAEEFYQGA